MNISEKALRNRTGWSVTAAYTGTRKRPEFPLFSRIFGLLHMEQGKRDSNPHERFWRPYMGVYKIKEKRPFFAIGSIFGSTFYPDIPRFFTGKSYVFD